MGLNAVEIILDTSESMGKRIFSSLDITKIDLAKSILENLFYEWDTRNCGHKLYIIYNQKFTILSLKNIKDLFIIIA